MNVEHIIEYHRWRAAHCHGSLIMLRLSALNHYRRLADR
jgi:hypothetical protein